MRAFIVLFIIIVLLLCVHMLNRKVAQVKEGFNVLGGISDVRYGQLGSTAHNSTSRNAWISVAKFVNNTPNQSHAATVEIYPRNRRYGSTRQNFSVTVANNATTQDSDPVFVQQNIYDSLADATSSGPSFVTGALVWTQDPKVPLTNTYELFLQVGVENGYGFPCVWHLNDFQTTDVVAVADVAQVAAPPAGTKTYAPRIIGGAADPKTIGTFPTLRVGDNDTENRIAFKGVTADGGSDQGNTYNMSVISERLYGGPDKSEMLLFKGNDAEACGNGSCGPDRIRMDSTGDVQIQTGGGSRTYDPVNNAGQTVFHARDDGRVSIGLQGQGKNGSADRPTWMFNPYNDRIGAPTVFIDRLEVGGDPQGNNKTPAVLRLHQWGTGAMELYKPPGQTVYLRETPNNGAAGSSFNNFQVQSAMGVTGKLSGSDIAVSGNLLSSGADINHHPPSAVKLAADQTKVWDSAGGEGANGNGVKIQIWDNYRGSGQLASYIPSTGQILWTNSGRCLDLPSNITTNGNQLQQYDCNNSPAQTWDMGSGGTIVHRASKKCVDLNGANTANGNKVQLWDCNGAAAQKWII